MKYGNLNFLEPSGPLQDCKGTDLPLLRSIIEGLSVNAVFVAILL